jgi:hypothetical protein
MLRAVDEERGFQDASYDESGTGAGAVSRLPSKIEFVSCQSRNLSTGAYGARALALSRLKGETWQAPRSS